MTISKLTRNGLDKLRCSAGLGCLALAAALSAQGAPLTPGEPIVLEKTTGKFDFIRIDAAKRRLLLAHTGNKSFEVFDPSNKVLETWTTVPATNPHGMALVPDSETVLVAGGSGKLALINRSSGKMVASADIAPRVDEMAYDPGLHTAYCASAQGKISVVDVASDKLTAVGDVPTTSGLKSIAVDTKTHTVWTAYAKGDQSFVQPFTPGK